MGIPIIAIQFITIFSAKKMMDEDKAWVVNVRRKNSRREDAAKKNVYVKKEDNTKLKKASNF